MADAWMMTDTGFYTHFLVVSNYMYMYIQIGSIQPNRKKELLILSTRLKTVHHYMIFISVSSAPQILQKRR